MLRVGFESAVKGAITRSSLSRSNQQGGAASELMVEQVRLEKETGAAKERMASERR